MRIRIDVAGHTAPVAALLATLLVVVGLATAPSASAHAYRTAAAPAENAVLTSGPDRVAATFNEPMQEAFAAMTVVGPDGKLWSTGSPEVQGAVVSVAVAPLGPAGEYTVNYRVTSADGHVVTGSWSFQVSTPGTGTPAPSAVAQPPAGIGPSDGSNGGGLPVLPFLAGSAVLLGAGVWWAVRRSRNRG